MPCNNHTVVVEQVDRAFRDRDWLLKYFKQTETEPKLYWCPVSDEIVADREAKLKAKENKAPDLRESLNKSKA